MVLQGGFWSMTAINFGMSKLLLYLSFHSSILEKSFRVSASILVAAADALLVTIASSDTKEFETVESRRPYACCAVSGIH
jgi:hypothetical protein